ncbi:MAG: SWIM zinc finger family protein, partial [Sciscionella sp.]
MTSYFPRPTHARHVEGGLKARSKRGAIAQTWWSGRFIEVLESLGVGGRLQRGRSYARKGQVIDLRVAVGAVTAHVQGSRAKPYRVRIGINAFGKREWAQVEQALAENAWYTAKLLAGEMPDDIEEV